MTQGQPPNIPQPIERRKPKKIARPLTQDQADALEKRKSARKLTDLMNFLLAGNLFLFGAILLDPPKKQEPLKPEITNSQEAQKTILEIARQMTADQNLNQTKLLSSQLDSAFACKFFDTVKIERDAYKLHWEFIDKIPTGKYKELDDILKEVYRYASKEKIANSFNVPLKPESSCGLKFWLGFKYINGSGDLAKGQDFAKRFLKIYANILAQEKKEDLARGLVKLLTLAK